MEQWERELYTSRIIAAKTRIKVGRTVLYVVAPSREQRHIANEVYRDALRDAELDGALNEDDLNIILFEQSIWTPEMDEERKKLDKALEDLKVGLFENRMRSNAKLTIRQALKKTRDEMTRLDGLKHGLDFVTVHGLAISAKYRYLIGACLRYEDGTPYWTDESWNEADPFVDSVLNILTSEKVTDSQVRELARTEPWRTLWGSRNAVGRGLFDCAAVDMTDDQRNLVLWSTIFDNIREYPDAPGEDVFEDDDMLDGWMIIARRKRENHQASQEANSIGNAKIRDASEIFVPADTIEDAKRVEKMNDPEAMSTKKQRMTYLKGKGEVNEVYMPDTAQRIQMELNTLEMMKIRQGR